jgi:hypothetical protein
MSEEEIKLDRYAKFRKLGQFQEFVVKGGDWRNALTERSAVRLVWVCGGQAATRVLRFLGCSVGMIGMGFMFREDLLRRRTLGMLGNEGSCMDFFYPLVRAGQLSMLCPSYTSARRRPDPNGA